MRPVPGSYPDYYENYIPLILDDNLVSALLNNWKELRATLSQVPAEKENFAYAPGKWTLKQVIIHMIDAERVFCYRALRFARKDPQQPLPFDENMYVANTDVSARSVKDLLEEYETVRSSTISLFRSFSTETQLLKGDTTYGSTTVLAIGYLAAGHALHHLNVIKQRYL